MRSHWKLEIGLLSWSHKQVVSFHYRDVLGNPISNINLSDLVVDISKLTLPNHGVFPQALATRYTLMNTVFSIASSTSVNGQFTMSSICVSDEMTQMKFSFGAMRFLVGSVVSKSCHIRSRTSIQDVSRVDPGPLGASHVSVNFVPNIK